MIIADTNLLLRAAVDDDVAQSQLARQFLARVENLAIPLHAVCEFVWVLSRRYKTPATAIAHSVRGLVEDPRVYCDRSAVAAGLAFLDAGGDFADGVIEFEGRRLGGDTFATFDRKAAAIIRAHGRPCVLLESE